MPEKKWIEALTSSEKIKKDVVLYYDWECVLCQNVARYFELKSKCNIKLINVRENPDKLKYLQDQWINMESGAVVDIDWKLSQWKDITDHIEDLIETKWFIDYITKKAIKNKIFTVLTYPIAKFIRRVNLKFKWVKKFEEKSS